MEANLSTYNTPFRTDAYLGNRGIAGGIALTFIAGVTCYKYQTLTKANAASSWGATAYKILSGLSFISGGLLIYGGYILLCPRSLVFEEMTTGDISSIIIKTFATWGFSLYCSFWLIEGTLAGNLWITAKAVAGVVLALPFVFVSILCNAEARSSVIKKCQDSIEEGIRIFLVPASSAYRASKNSLQPAEMPSEPRLNNETFLDYFSRAGYLGLPEELKTIMEIMWDIYGSQNHNLRNFAKSRNVSLPKGIILSGPPRTGKSHFGRKLTAAVKGLSTIEVITISGPAFRHPHVGQTESKIREPFEKAKKNPAVFYILIIDEFDSIGCQRGAHKQEYANTAVNQLLTSMDGLENASNIMVIGTTNSQELLDTALLSAGRFGSPIVFELPGNSLKEEFLKLRLHKLVTDRLIAPQLQDEISNFNSPLLSRIHDIALHKQTLADIEELFKTARNRWYHRVRTAYLEHINGNDSAARALSVSAFVEARIDNIGRLVSNDFETEVNLS